MAVSGTLEVPLGGPLSADRFSAFTDTRQTPGRTCSSSGCDHPQFTRDELAAAFENFEQTVDRAAQTRDWDPWVEQYTDDVTYVEHAAGTMHGRDEVRTWI